MKSDIGRKRNNDDIEALDRAIVLIRRLIEDQFEGSCVGGREGEGLMDLIWLEQERDKLG